MVAGELKARAVLAKKSLLETNYSVSGEKKNGKGSKNYFREYLSQFPKFNAKYEFLKLNNEKLKLFEKQVKTLLKENPDSFHYIGKLIDQKKFKKMSTTEQQRMVFCMSDRFLAVLQKVQKK